MNSKYDVAVIGGGIVGAATAFKLQRRYPQKRILLIEKEKEPAFHQTGNNSGVIHSGLYYTPGSKKAENCVRGRKELVKFAREYNVPHDICGKVVAAATPDEIPQLERIYNIGLQNKIEGIEKITGDEVRDIEPFCKAVAGIRVPVTGIIDYRDATRKMLDAVIQSNSQSNLVFGEAAVDFTPVGSKTCITTTRNTYTADHMVFCGGLQADRLAKKDGIKLQEKVLGFRGDYYELTDQAKHKVNHLIYPVPNPEFPFLGVHFTRMTNGEIECGPNAVFTFKREGYGKTDFNWKDTVDALTYSGTWQLFFKNMKFGIDEYRRAFSKKLFLKTLQRLIPDLQLEDLKPGRSGVRALLLKQDGDTKDDFKIVYNERSIHVLNAPSPAATASLAIGDDVCDMARDHFGWH